MLARLLLLVFMLLSLVAAMRYHVDETAAYIFVAVTFLITIPYAVWLRRETTTEVSMLYQFAVDVIIVTGLIHFTGGANSQLSLLYPLVILSAGVVVSGRLALKIALLSVFLYATLIALETRGSLVYRGPFPSPYDQPGEVFQVLMFRILIFALFAAAVSYIADTCFYQEKQLERLRLIANAILDSVGVPLMAVYSDGRILQCNGGAAAMLDMPPPELIGKHLKDVFGDAVPNITNPEDGHRIWNMKRSNGDLFPVTFQASSGNFPAAVIGSLTDRANGIELYLVAFRDMTDILAQQNAETLSTRQKTAAGMIAEMAHVVRNPLTAIRGAGEILNSAVDAMFLKSDRLTEKDWDAVKAMSELIFQQTRELNDKVDYFLKCAAEDPDKLMALVEDADEWAARLFSPKGTENGLRSIGG